MYDMSSVSSIYLGVGFKNASRKEGLAMPHPHTVRYEPLFKQQNFQVPDVILP